MDEKYLMLLEMLFNSEDKVMNVKELSSKSGFSGRSVLRYISIINSLDEKSSFKIVSVKNKGYQLKIIDEEGFNAFYNSVFRANVIQDNSLFLLKLVMNDAASSKLIDDLNYSEASVVRLVKSINDKLSNRNLKIRRKKNIYYIEGNEIQIRNFGQYLWRMRGFSTDCLEDSQVLEYVKYCDYLRKNKISDSKELQSYLFISLVRSIRGHNLELSPIVMEFYNKDSSYDELSKALSAYYLTNYEKQISKDELVYLLLATKGNDETGFNENIEEIMLIVNNIIKKIDSRYETDFSSDDELLNSICSHIASNISHYLLMSKVDNSLLNQIRLNYTNEHVYALELANDLSELLDIKISDEDVGYLTLHFANSNEKKNKNARIDSTIIYSQSLTTAKILQLRLKNVYPQMNIDIRKKSEKISKSNLSIVYEDELDTDDYIKVTPFLNEEDQRIIDQALVEKTGYQPFIKMCKEEEFYVVEKAKTKDELLQQITETLVVKGLLNKEEATNIIERENLSSTEIVSGVSFPHCIVKTNSFLSIFILKQPVFWNSNYVKLVLVMGYNKSNKGNKEAIKYLFSNLSDQKKLERLLKTRTFDEFINVLRGKENA